MCDFNLVTFCDLPACQGEEIRVQSATENCFHHKELQMWWIFETIIKKSWNLFSEENYLEDNSSVFSVY